MSIRIKIWRLYWKTAKKKENETIEMQERTISFRQTMRQEPPPGKHRRPTTPPNLLGGNVIHHV